MTTQTINDIADLARILKEQPEWADTIRGILLGEALLNLPAQLTEFIQVTQETNRQVREELAQLAQQSAQHTQQLALHNQQLARINELLTQHTQQLEQHNQQLAQINELLAQHTQQLAQINELLAQHTQQLAQINELLAQQRLELNNLQTRMSRAEGRLGNLEGNDYERRIRAKAVFRAQHILGLENAYIALTQDSQAAPQFHSAINRAINRGLISLDQAGDLYDADLIISDANNRHVVIEVSITADEADITRARRRADLLATATGGPATPALITAYLNEIQQEQANAASVATFLIPYP